eukprot:4732442-Amphidinium_carterae.1
MPSSLTPLSSAGSPGPSKIGRVELTGGQQDGKCVQNATERLHDEIEKSQHKCVATRSAEVERPQRCVLCARIFGDYWGTLHTVRNARARARTNEAQMERFCIKAQRSTRRR